MIFPLLILGGAVAGLIFYGRYAKSSEANMEDWQANERWKESFDRQFTRTASPGQIAPIIKAEHEATIARALDRRASVYGTPIALDKDTKEIEITSHVMTAPLGMGQRTTSSAIEDALHGGRAVFIERGVAMTAMGGQTLPDHFSIWATLPGAPSVAIVNRNPNLVILAEPISLGNLL